MSNVKAVVVDEKVAIKNPTVMVKAQIAEPLKVKKAPAKKSKPVAKPKQDNEDSVWVLAKMPKEGDGVTGARLVICQLLSKAPGKKMERSELAKVVAKAAKSQQDGSYLLSLKRKFLVDGGWVKVS